MPPKAETAERISTHNTSTDAFSRKGVLRGPESNSQCLDPFFAKNRHFGTVLTGLRKPVNGEAQELAAVNCHATLT